jgi:signal transduction histidine kinase
MGAKLELGGFVTRTAWDAEVARVSVLRGLDLLDTEPEDRFDRITRLVQETLDVPVAYLSLMDMHRQFLKSRIGLQICEAPREGSFCDQALALGRLLEVPDATKDPAFADNPAVTGEFHLRFYAGIPLRDPTGYLLGTLCAVDVKPRAMTDAQRRLFADLARWTELELAAVQTVREGIKARQARADFVSVVSHELRTPLTSIHGSLELVGSGQFGELTPQVARLVGIATNNTHRLIRLADDVLVYTRLQDGMLRLRLADTELIHVVGHAVDSVIGVADGAEVEILAEPPDIRLHGDTDRLVQVFTNLLANAVQVAPAGSTVRIGGRVDGEVVHVSVTDSGPGVPQEQLDKIFEPFAQGEVPTGGAGLGLAISRGIVQAHSGTVVATSRPAGGSTFTVTLPLRGPDTDKPWW